MVFLTGWTIFFLAVHSHFLICTSSRRLDSLPSFIEPDSLPLRHAVVHNATGDVYVAGYNVLYQLGSDLKVKQKVITGPELDHPDCLHPSYPCDHIKSSTNNVNQFLDIIYHMESPMLLLCGTLYGRLCQVRPLDDIGSYSWIGPYNESLGFSSIEMGHFNQAFFAPGNDGQLSLYAGVHDDPDGRKPKSTAFLTSKILVRRNEQFFFEYSFSNDTSFTAVRFEGNTTRMVIDGFIHGKFVYFLILLHPRNGTPDTRLVRVCTEDGTPHSYAELPIYCSYKDTVLYLAFSSFYGDTTAEMRQEHQLENKEKALYVSFVKYEKKVPHGSLICGFSMSSVVEAFASGRKSCLTNDLIKGATCQLKENAEIDGDLCRSGPYVVEPLISKILVAYKQGCVISALTILEQNGVGIAVAGMADGSVMKANFGRRNWYSQNFLLDKSQNEEILSPLNFDLSHEHIYFLVSNKVVKYPVRSCSIHESCKWCVLFAKADPLQCGWCNGRCTQIQECHDPNSFSKDTCSPSIYEVTPLRGPVKGGTLVQVTGDNFGSYINEGDNLISVAGSPCKIVSWNYTEVKCTLGLTSKEISGPVELNVTDTSQSARGFNVIGSATSARNFTYFVVPRLYAIFPSKGPTSGGTNVILYGENLDIGTHRVFNVRGRRCTQMAINTNSAWCVTGNISNLEFPDSIAIIVDNETFEMEAHVPPTFNMSGRFRNFVYLPDPEIHQIHPGITTVSGLINVTVTGLHLDSVDFPEMAVTISLPQTVDNLEFREPCWVKPESKGTVMTCQTPHLRRPGIPILTRTHPLLAYMAFIMDIQELRELPKTRKSISRLLYYPDPEIRPFQEVKKLLKNETVMEIEGRHLDIIQSTDNLKVLIDGSYLCNISTLTSHSLKCTLPSDLMSNSSMRGTNISVEVIMGVSRLSLGYMEITEQESRVYFWVIFFGVFAYILVTILILYFCYNCLKKSSFCAAFQNLLAAEQQMTTRGESRNDYTPVPVATTTLTLQPLQADTQVHSIVGDSLVEPETMRLLEVEGLIILKQFLTLGKQIGHGQFGYVVEGILRSPTGIDEKKVAVKGLKNINSWQAAESVASFMEEALIMKDFRHDNVLTLIGVCFEGAFPLVVLPYMENGDLSTYIRNEEKVITVKELLQFALDVAKGMAYLAVNQFVHRDLAARNCILNSELVVKVADFGLSRDIYERDYYSSENARAKLPIKWMSPESLEKNIYSVQTDVWSYGVLLWEIMTRGTVPYADVDNGHMLSFLKTGRRLEQPEYCPDELYIVMLACWNADLKKRPGFDLIEYHVRRIVKQYSFNEQTTTEPTISQNTTYYNYDQSNYLKMDGYMLSSEILKDC